MMSRPNILFVSADLEYSVSSASIRNVGVVKALAKTHRIESLELIGSKSRLITKIGIKNTVVRVPKFRVGNTATNTKKSECLRKIKDFLKIFIIDRLFTFTLRFNFEKFFFDDIDVVIISSDPKGIYNLHFNKSFNKLFKPSVKFVHYWGDPLVGDVNFKPNGYHRKLEEKYFSCADIVMFTSKRLCARKRLDFPATNFFYLPRLMQPDVPSGYIRFKPSELGNIVVAGDYHSKFRDITPICRVCTSLKINISFYGEGNSVFESRYVNYHERLSLVELNDEMAKADLLVIIGNKNSPFQVPGKFYDAYCLDMPILVLLEDESLIDELDVIINRFYSVSNKDAEISEFFLKKSSITQEWKATKEINQDLLLQLENAIS